MVRKLTKLQVKLYMDSRLKTKTQQSAAARAEISISSAHRIEKGKTRGERKAREWQTRKDPFDEVWKSVIAPQLELHPNLLAITLLEKLQSDFPAKYPDKLLRTLQRRVRQWRALYGPEKEVIFRQEHYPGRMGISDFTLLKKEKISIEGEEFKHILYHFRLSYSGWSFLKVVQGGESCTALLEGLQEALWRLGGSPKEHRTDSLSAAYKNLSKEAALDMTKQYNEFCVHYKMTSTRNNRGVSHENGSIESPHGHIKRRIGQSLLIRGSNDFSSVESYQSWLEGVVTNHNRRNAKEVDFERKSLQKLPRYKTTDYSEMIVRVHSSSMIEIKKVTYSVPSRLCGETLRAHVYQDRIELYLGSKQILVLKRVYTTGSKRKKVIDYRHVIHSLRKKPSAFRYSQLRNNLLPNQKYRDIWEHVNNTMEARAACKYIVNAMYLANEHDCEKEIANYILLQIKQKHALTIASLENRYKKEATSVPEVIVAQHSLLEYDQILRN
jgi:hypothetical protein